MDELKPCPFCGGEASATGSVRYSDCHEAWFSDGTRITEAFFCGCVACGISNRGLIGHQTREKAIAAWNRRTPPPPAAQAIAELSDHIGSYVKGEALTQGGIDRLIESAQRAIALCKQLAGEG